MAEHVQLRKELSLAEYEGMKKIKLFDVSTFSLQFPSIHTFFPKDEELRKIKKTRESFEYKLEKHTKELKDYCEYIKYERSLLGIIGDRRLIRHIKEKKAIERLIAIKIHGLYSKTLARFSGDLRLWDSFVKFCCGTHFTPDIPRIHDRLLQLHIGKPEVWLKAILWEYSEMHNMVRVKHLLTNALKLHPKDRDLNKAFVQIELTEAQTIEDSEELTDEQKEKDLVIALGHCEMVYNSMKSIVDLDFTLEMLQTSLQFSFAHSFSRKILMDIYATHRNHPKTWNCFAQSELWGISLFDPTENAVGVARGPRTARTNIEKCVDMYEFAVKQVPCQEMFTFYIDAMLELNGDMTKERKLRRTCLANAFKVAHEQGFMSEKHYLIYLQLLFEADSINTGQMDEIFTKALKTNSIEVWKLRLTYGIKHETKEKLPELFQRITKNVTGDDILEIYKIFYAFLTTNAEPNVVEAFLQAAIKHETRSVPTFFKPEYIEWVTLNKDLHAARRVYKELALNSFPCLGLHTKMLQLECASQPVNLAEARRCFDYAVQLFGFKDASIWVEYIRFERDFGNPKMTTNLYQRAKSTLKGDELIQKFIEEHTTMQLETV